MTESSDANDRLLGDTTSRWRGHEGRTSLFIAVPANACFRRIFPVARRPGEGRLTDPTPVVPPWPPEPSFLPLNGHCRRRITTTRSDVDSWSALRVSECKSEVSYLSQLHLLDAIGSAWLNL